MVRWVIAGVLAFAVAADAGTVDRTVVVVMIDGFPARLLEKADTPHFDRLLAMGVWSDRLVPAFPSLSHTNWASISTGCWPEHHGIVSNRFEIDGHPVDRATSLDADTMLGCQLIHDVAESQGVHAAALGWTGARSSKRGALASVVMPYFDNEDAESDVERARQVVRELDRDDPQRPRLLLAYFNGPDGAEHHSGMDSPRTRAAIEMADRALGLILARMEALSAEREVTLLVLTDHGMTPVDGLLNVTRILANAGVAAQTAADGPLAFVYLEDPSDRDAAVERLGGDDRFEVVLPEDAPLHWRLGSSPRVGDFMLYTHVPWFFPNDEDMPGWLPPFSRWWPEDVRIPGWLQHIGMHGYAIEDEPAMGGLFVAWGSGVGPARKLTTAVRAVDVHPTIARLLWIAPGSPLDGRVLEEILSD